MTSIWWWHEGHLGLVMRVPGCGDLVISQEQVIGEERCEDCSGATPSHLSSEANVTFMEHFNGRTMFRNFVSHLVNFYKDQGLIHQRFSRNAQNISSGFNTNFDVSVSQCSGQWSSGPMVRDTTWPDPDHESVACSLASPELNVASDISAEQINV